jgi:hypothetical protein
MTQFGTVYPTSQNGGITNGREIGAYAIAQAIKIILSFALSFSGWLSPFFIWAYRAGGPRTVFLVSATISVFWTAVLLVLFLALRGALGGVPAMIAEPGREHAMASRGGEIGAYVIAFAFLIAGLTALNSVVLGPIYVSLNHSGQEMVTFAISFSTALVGAVLAYILFVALRSALCPRAAT